ncbi:MAG: DUF3857 domain-containing protein [Acidobacteria bacterium]|nr:DUF3857 domain-containing protein [Acidobacteriota bacterium]
MKLTIPLSLFVCLSVAVPLAAQEVPWEPVPKDVAGAAQRYPEAKNEGAVVLFKHSYIYVSNLGLDLFTKRVDYVRIQILDDRGQKYANVEVPYNKFERLNGIVARTITPSGEIVPVPKEQIFDKVAAKIGRYIQIRVKSFAFPKAEKGSILEYQVVTNKDGAWIARPHIFDEYLFTAESTLEFNCIREVRYQVATQTSADFPLQPVTKDTPLGYMMRWDVKNLPALPEEDYGPPRGMVAHRVGLVPDKRRDFVFVKSWDSIAGYIETDYRFFIQTSGEAKRVSNQVTSGAGSDREKLARLYAYVLEKIRPLAAYGYFYSGTADEILKTGVGDASDRNWLLITMLKAVGLKASPALAATKDYSILPEGFPSFSEFDRTICYVELPDGALFVDAARPGIPVGSLPSETEGIRVVVAQGSKAKIMTTPAGDSSKNRLEVQTELSWVGATSTGGDAAPAMKIVFDGSYAGHKAEGVRANLFRNAEGKQEDALKDWASKRIQGADVVAAKANPPDGPEPLKFNVELRAPFDADPNGRVLLRLKFWTGMKESPLPSSSRITPVMFEYPYAESEVLRFKIPDGFALQGSPQGGTVQTPYFDYELKILKSGDTVEFQRRFSLKDTEVPPENYGALRQSYSKVIQWDNLPILLVKK